MTNPDLRIAGASSIRAFMRARTSGALADRAFAGVILVCAVGLLCIVLLILAVLMTNAKSSMQIFGWNFLRMRTWDPAASNFGAFPFVFGTILSSFLALLISVPLSIAVAIFLTEICPRRLRAPISFATEILAAIPSVVYGLWAVFVLVPLMRNHIGPALRGVLGWTGLFAGPNFGISILTGGMILAIMIFPFISAISRDVMWAVPVEQREAALALGATRWEMVRLGVLRNARVGIVGAVMLGLGRALGETMAVTMVIGNHPAISRNLLAPAATLASVIANEFSEASGDLYLSALIEIGLVLFVVTISVNAIARVLVWLVTRRGPLVEV